MSISSRFPGGPKLPPNTPLLMLGDVDRWQEERKVLVQQRGEIDLKIADLDQKLSAAEHFIRLAAASAIKDRRAETTYNDPGQEPLQAELLPRKGNEPRTEANINAAKTMRDIALRLAAERPDGFLPRDVVEVLHNDERISDRVKNVNENYIYMVLKRLRAERKLAKVDQRYVLMENVANPNEVEDVGDAPPVEHLPGFKLVPLTKEERVRAEVAQYLVKRPGKRAHRATIADYLASVGALGNEKNPIRALSAYLVRWPEFVSDGEGNFTYRPPEKTSGGP